MGKNTRASNLPAMMRRRPRESGLLRDPGLPELQQLRSQMDEILSDLKLLIAEVRKTVLYSPDQQRTWFSIEEAAELLGKSPYTVREWCRAGRINARKTGEKRGSAEVWRISAQEMTRLREDGLLEPDFHRNRRSEV